MRLKITFGVGAAVAMIALLVAGCGGGGSSTASGSATTSGSSSESGSTTSSSSPPSKVVFVKQANEVCAQVPKAYFAKLSALENEARKNKKKVTKAEISLKAAVPPLHTAVEGLEKLTPPKGQEAQVEAIVKALESAAKGLEAKPASQLSGPKSPYAEFQKLTKAYGLSSCEPL